MEPDPAILDTVTTLLGLIEKSSFAAMAAHHRLHGAIADAQPARSGEAFDYSDGTAPGGAEAMSEPDAVIVQRLRARSPDGRFEGSSDAELLQLFKRNRQVVRRSDDDAIAAMTHPRWGDGGTLRRSRCRRRAGSGRGSLALWPAIGLQLGAGGVAGDHHLPAGRP